MQAVCFFGINTITYYINLYYYLLYTFRPKMDSSYFHSALSKKWRKKNGRPKNRRTRSLHFFFLTTKIMMRAFVR